MSGEPLATSNITGGAQGTTHGDSSEESEGEDLGDSKKIHRRISTNRSIKIESSLKEGYLDKLSHFQRWNRRYFRLKSQKLYYAKNEKSDIFEDIDLAEASVAETKGKSSVFEVITPFHHLVLCATNRRAMEDWITAVRSAASRIFFEPNYRDIGASTHSWIVSYNAKPTYCNVCRESLSGVTLKKGLCCEICKYRAHKRCATRAAAQCKWSTLASVGSEVIEDNGLLFMPHQWLEGNLPINSRCAASTCNHSCGSVFHLQDFRCLWCKATVHKGCKLLVNQKCSLGQWEISTLSPISISQVDLDGYWRSYNSPSSCCPLLVFVNTRSGDNQGVKFLRRFKQLLNPAQVQDLTYGGPTFGLKLFQSIESFRILICGGDGTVGWVLSEIDRLNLTARCQVAVLPLGTGNDLARVLGWGGTITDETQLSTILEKLEHSQIKMLDRWSVLTYEGSMPPPRQLSLQLDPMTAYEDHVAAHLTKIIQSDDPTKIIRSSKVLCGTVRNFVTQVGLMCETNDGPFGTGADALIAKKCALLNEKLNLLLQSLDYEVPLTSLFDTAADAGVCGGGGDDGSFASSRPRTFSVPLTPAAGAAAPTSTTTNELLLAMDDSAKDAASAASMFGIEESPESTSLEVEKSRAHSFHGGGGGYQKSLSASSSVVHPSSLLRSPSSRPPPSSLSESMVGPGAPPHEKTYQLRDQLMSRANSLKKAVRQIIEHAEKVIDEQNAERDGFRPPPPPAADPAASVGGSSVCSDASPSATDIGRSRSPGSERHKETTASLPSDSTASVGTKAATRFEQRKQRPSPLFVVPSTSSSTVGGEVGGSSSGAAAAAAAGGGSGSGGGGGLGSTSQLAPPTNVDKLRISPRIIRKKGRRRSNSMECLALLQRYTCRGHGGAGGGGGSVGSSSHSGTRYSSSKAVKSHRSSSWNSLDSLNVLAASRRNNSTRAGPTEDGTLPPSTILEMIIGSPIFPVTPKLSSNAAHKLASESFISRMLLAGGTDYLTRGTGGGPQMGPAAGPGVIGPGGSIFDEDVSLDEYRELRVMNNYFGIGLDAKIAYEFHTKREEHPEKCRSRIRNQVWYGVMSSKAMLQRTYKNLEQRVELECDGQKIPLPSMQGIVILNIGSYMGGTNFWGGTKENDYFTAPSYDDRILEVVAIFGIMQLAVSRVVRLQHHRIAQCRTVKITIVGEEGVAVQVDGEAWVQPPGFIRLVHKNRIQVLSQDEDFENMLKTWSEKVSSASRDDSSSNVALHPAGPTHSHAAAATSATSSSPTPPTSVTAGGRALASPTSTVAAAAATDTSSSRIFSDGARLNDRELNLLRRFASDTRSLIDSIKRLANGNNETEHRIFHSASEIDNYLQRLMPANVQIVQQPGVRNLVSSLLRRSIILCRDTNNFIKDHPNLSKIVQLESGVRAVEESIANTSQLESLAPIAGRLSQAHTSTSQGHHHQMSLLGRGSGTAGGGSRTPEIMEDEDSIVVVYPPDSDTDQHKKHYHHRSGHGSTSSSSSSGPVSFLSGVMKRIRPKDKSSLEMDTNVNDWSREDVGFWLEIIGFSEYKDNFYSHDIHGPELCALERTDLQELGISKVGHLKRLERSIKGLNKICTQPPAPPLAPPLNTGAVPRSSRPAPTLLPRSSAVTESADCHSQPTSGSTAASFPHSHSSYPCSHSESCQRDTPSQSHYSYSSSHSHSASGVVSSSQRGFLSSPPLSDQRHQDQASTSSPPPAAPAGRIGP